MERKINSIRTSNEGREIAVFEEENLALRRELQEARASRTLAENHAAKCVNFAVSRSVTPVTFNTPCITSTPVRTALTDTCFLLPAIPPTISSHTFSASSVLRSHSAEVAALQFISEVTNQCRNSALDSGSVFREDSLTKENVWSETSLASCTCTNDDVTNAVEIEPCNKIGNQNSGFIDTSSICEILSVLDLDDCFMSFKQKETCDVDIAKNDGKVKPSTMTEEEKKMKQLSTVTLEEPTGDQLLEICEAKMPSITEKHGAKDLESFRVLQEQKDLSDKPSDVVSKMEKLINHSDNHSFWQKLRKFHNQRGSFKKSRRKKGHLRRLFSESDKPDKDSYQDIEILASTIPPCTSGGNCDTASEDEDCFSNNDRANRAIIDVPDVVVIGGGSIVPKDLCSTRTLTSRTQTAPSRATYTTAYI